MNHSKLRNPLRRLLAIGGAALFLFTAALSVNSANASTVPQRPSFTWSTLLNWLESNPVKLTHPAPRPVPEAKTGLVLLPFLLVVLAFSSRKMLSSRTSLQKIGR
ncbi:MAG: hypothetical protein JO076_16250 [Verrucomicrobia bacterium]|nr:hypothetical protein [Verrucomicrobiota bacterium]